ncbi:40S ribosomal protein S12 [Aplysia californica]|uniref:40S ribosomal protein S12 n=1 Tax=Aplysia californica TaxID=6500 RepID=A0ABM0JAS8_APLCA|nr:40S ribosomal protein S12 [Aplysia californica]
MSDAEGDDVQSAGAVAASMDIYEALQEVLKTALIHDGLCRGVKEATKALDRRQAHLCILANSVDEPLFTKLIEALCAEHGISLLKVDDAKKLGEWSGLCKLDKDGKARKVNACGVVVVRDYGKESQALDVVREYLKTK